ncbi:glycosyltransferase family 2 protein [Methylobacterium sp. CM6247]
MKPTYQPEGTIGIVILNYNGWRDTIDCVLSVLRVPEPISIIVVDNASPDGSEKHILSWATTDLRRLNEKRAQDALPPITFAHLTKEEQLSASQGEVVDITFIQAGYNGGYAAGNNIGIRFMLARGCEFIWLLNNDTIVEPSALTWLLARAREDPQIGLCGSTLVYYEHPDIIQARGGAHFRPWRGWGADIGCGSSLADRVKSELVEAQLSYINGASVLASRPYLEAVGLLEESYFLYWEEIDWAFRARRRFKLGYAQSSVVRHKVGASIGTRQHESQSILADFYLLRGAVAFCIRYSRISLPGILLGVARQMVGLALRGDWSRIGQLLRALTGAHYPANRRVVPERSAE